ncbi:MAG: FkbM family methyltransferase [Pyrinomonadaceae bacterium]
MKPTFVHRLFRSYIFNTPINKGKYRLSDLALRISPCGAGRLLVETRDGRNLTINTENASYRFIYFTGQYEQAITEIFSAIVCPEDVCLDIGANIGWYTTVFQQLVGESGEVHAFEPVPQMFEDLKKNVEMNEPPKNVILNNLALGDVEKEIEMHIFDGLPDGHASMATFGGRGYVSVPAKMITLNSYLENNNIDNVRFVKMDVEGAELMMLKGASRLFEQEKLPVMEIEMALATTSGFNYLPNDLIEYIRGHGSYDFFEIDESRFTLRKIDGFQSDDIGANVLCLPRDFDSGRLAKWFI